MKNHEIPPEPTVKRKESLYGQTILSAVNRLVEITYFCWSIKYYERKAFQDVQTLRVP